MFPSINRAKTIDISVFTADTIEKKNALEVLQTLKEIPAPSTNVFTRDNTNAVEGYFSVVKRRITSSAPTLVNVFEAVDFTERCVMAQRNPASLTLPDGLSGFLLWILTKDVLAVMSRRRVDGLLGVVVDVALDILCEHPPQDTVHSVVERAVKSGSPIGTFAWMPSDWRISTTQPTPTHTVKRVESNDSRRARTL